MKHLIIYILFFCSAHTLLATTISTNEVNVAYDKNDMSIPLYLRYGYTDSLKFIRDQLALNAYAYEKVVSYKYGGNTQEGWDCSGFIKFMYAQFNIQLPRTASEMSKLGTAVTKEGWNNGDLLFFGSGNQITHVAMIYQIADGSKKIIHCTSSTGVTINTFDESSWTSYWSKKYFFSKRIIGT